MRKRIIGALCALLVTSSLSAADGDKRISFSADRGNGAAGKKNGVTILEGHAYVSIGSLTISADRIELSGKDFRHVNATGNVTGADSEKGFSFTAALLSYDRDLEVASFRGNAQLTDSKNGVESSAGIITYNQKTETALFQTDVRLKRKDIDCSSSFALYRRSLSLLDLSGSPSVLRGSDEFRADRISVNLQTEHITLDGTVSGTLKDTKPESAAPGGPAGAPGSPPGTGEQTPSGTQPPAGQQTPAGTPAPSGQAGNDPSADEKEAE